MYTYSAPWLPHHSSIPSASFIAIPILLQPPQKTMTSSSAPQQSFPWPRILSRSLQYYPSVCRHQRGESHRYHYHLSLPSSVIPPSTSKAIKLRESSTCNNYASAATKEENCGNTNSLSLKHCHVQPMRLQLPTRRSTSSTPPPPLSLSGTVILPNNHQTPWIVHM